MSNEEVRRRVGFIQVIGRNVRGCELITISTSMTTVSNSSSDRLARPMIFLKHRFTDRTNLSNNPPHHGALVTLNTHWTPTSKKYLDTSLPVDTALMILAVAINFLPLSEIIQLGSPLLEVNHLRNVSADMSVTKLR